MFDLGNSLIVGSPLRLFVLLVHTGGGNGSVAGSMWVESSHIEKGCVKIVSPEPICLHIKSSIFFSDGCTFSDIRTFSDAIINSPIIRLIDIAIYIYC